MTLFPEDGVDANDLLAHAEQAVQTSKKLGGNASSFHDRRLEVNALRTLRLEAELRRAVSRNEFTLLYQPQYELSSGNMTGAEALIRWQQQEGALVSPAEFIPALERTGMIVDVGDWVLNEACRQIASSPSQSELRVAINFSALQLQRTCAAEHILRTIRENEVAPERIEVELTESLLQENPDHVKDVLEELREAGVRIALDDFGTGYSSLAYLRRFPIDVLKIDGSFITDIGTTGRGADLTASIIALGHTLDMRVVAERVETQDQLAYLRDNGCDVGQGYLLGKPTLFDTMQPQLLCSHSP